MISSILEDLRAIFEFFNIFEYIDLCYWDFVEF